LRELLVCELARKGKLLVAEPYFEGGVPVVVDRKGAGEPSVGDLVVLRPGRGRARLERVLGPASRIEAVLEGLLWHEGVRRPHAPLPPPPAGDEPDRVDLRHLYAFTIDPEGAKDFDDALTFEREEGGGVRAWVHLADVSAHVPAGSPLDHDAAERGVSVYVPGSVAPMLPHELSDDACSLRPHQDRRCVTVELPFGPGLEPGEPRFYRSLIRSRERLTYGHAQAILAGDERAVDELAEALRLAEQVSAALRDRRFARGALRVEGREVEFAFDGEGGVERAWIE
jgi:ribonuclease R